jgi:DNA-binding response OmpR family regulator
MISGRISTGDIVNALLLGADDYIIKPFAEDELMARIYAELRSVQIRYDLLHLQKENATLRQQLKTLAE